MAVTNFEALSIEKPTEYFTTPHTQELIDRVQDLISRTPEGDLGHPILIEGDSGTGKSALLDEIERQILASGLPTTIFRVNFSSNGLVLAIKDGEITQAVKLQDLDEYWRLVRGELSKYHQPDPYDCLEFNANDPIETSYVLLRKYRKSPTGRRALFLFDDLENLHPNSVASLYLGVTHVNGGIVIATSNIGPHSDYFYPTWFERNRPFCGWENEAQLGDDFYDYLLNRYSAQLTPEQMAVRRAEIRAISGGNPEIAVRLATETVIDTENQAQQKTTDIQTLKTYYREIIGELPEDIDPNLLWEVLWRASAEDRFYFGNISNVLLEIYPMGIPFSQGKPLLPLMKTLRNIHDYLQRKGLVSSAYPGDRRRLDYTLVHLIRKIQELSAPYTYGDYLIQLAKIFEEAADADDCIPGSRIYQRWHAKAQHYRQEAERICPQKTRRKPHQRSTD